jgi:hypothetical protein
VEANCFENKLDLAHFVDIVDSQNRIAAQQSHAVVAVFARHSIEPIEVSFV